MVQKRYYLQVFLCVLFSLVLPSCTGKEKAPDTFTTSDGHFSLNGEPFVIKAAELHYPRIPQEYWEHRIEMCKALGMNTVCLYVFWNAHESEPGNFNFEGQNDIRKFIELCDKHDMKVILRPGPYVCAEWEMGGLPWWLLKKKDIELRHLDPYFMERVETFQQALANEIGDLTVDKGGPILMIQVENEYGAYGEDKPYVSAVRDILRKAFGNDVILFQCDWASNVHVNGLDDTVWCINFGTWADIDEQFEPLKKMRPNAPMMCSEFWSGWFDKWGAQHETRSADAMLERIDTMLTRGYSFSLYMTHGGTNWGHWAGANTPGYEPDVTSYDYDAPINEWGRPTPKYHALRKLLTSHNNGITLADIPDSIPTVKIGRFSLNEFAPLFNNLPDAITDTCLRTMEEYNQGFGSMVYRTTLPPTKNNSILTVDQANDYAQIFINGDFIGKLDRRHNEKELILPPMPEGANLDILVEAMGRINFGLGIKDFKGINGTVSLKNDKQCYIPEKWDIFLLPDKLEFYTSMSFQDMDGSCSDGTLHRGVYRGTFDVEKIGDTFLDFSQWGKGLVYVNGHALGRIWEIGPQQTLYMPGAWLKKENNEIIVFDILGPNSTDVEGLEEPILNNAKPEKKNRLAQAPVFSKPTAIKEGNFPYGTGWKKVSLDKVAKTRYLAIEALSNHDGGESSAIAEIYALTPDGNRIDRNNWTVLYVNSEDNINGNSTGDKAFDLQESTYWMSAPASKKPHTLVIDMGEENSVKSLEFLPRSEPGAPASINKFRIITSDTLD